MASPDVGTRCFKRPKTYDLDRGRVPRQGGRDWISSRSRFALMNSYAGCHGRRLWADRVYATKTQSRVIARSGTVFST